MTSYRNRNFGSILRIPSSCRIVKGWPFSHLGNMIGQAPFEKVQLMKRKHKKPNTFQFLKNKQQMKMVSLSLLKDGCSADKEAVRYYLTNSVKGEIKTETEGGIVDKKLFGPDSPVSCNSRPMRVVEQDYDQKAVSS